MPVDLFEKLVALRAAGVPCALCTVVRTAGSTPRKSAARMLVTQDGEIFGTVGGGRVEKQVCDAAQALVKQGEAAAPTILRYHLTRELGMCCGGEMEVFVEPMIPAQYLIVCGGGHVGHALVPLARSLGFLPIVVEDLEELGNRTRFPDAERIIDSFDVRDWKELPLDDRSYAVIVTRDHQQDQALLEQLLTLPLGYLGLIGSKRKVLMFRQRLINKGFTEAQLDSVHAPIGLDIGAETPEEIAIAIAAELVQVRASRRAAPRTTSVTGQSADKNPAKSSPA